MHGKPIAADVYDQIAEAYATRTETAAYNAYYERPAMMALIGDVEGKAILDVGCGHGHYAEQLLARGAARIVGLDASAKMIELARARLGDRVELQHADVARPLAGIAADTSFDLVICPLVLHYVEDWGPVLTSFHRLLRDGGAVVLSTGHPMQDFASSVSGDYFERELLHEAWSSFGVTMPTYRRSLAEIFDAVRGAGFVVDQLVEPRPAPELADIAPDVHERLSKAPAFLCLRLVRSTARA